MNIDTTVCVCLDKREAEWTELINEGKKNGLNIHPFICGDGKQKHLKYSYIDEPNPDVSNWIYGIPQYKKNHYNAFKCHQKIIKLAKTANFQNILIMEDDAYITSRFSKILGILSESNAIPVFDILYLGWWIGTEGDNFNDAYERLWNKYGTCGIDKSRQVGGLHGALINQSMYDTILGMQPINPIDAQLNLMHQYIKSYYIYPKIIHTKTTYSYCEGSVIERMKI